MLCRHISAPVGQYYSRIVMHNGFIVIAASKGFSNSSNVASVIFCAGNVSTVGWQWPGSYKGRLPVLRCPDIWDSIPDDSDEIISVMTCVLMLCPQCMKELMDNNVGVLKESFYCVTKGLLAF